MKFSLKIKILINLMIITLVVFAVYTVLVLRSYKKDYVEAIQFRSAALGSLVKKKMEDQITSYGGGLTGIGIMTLDLKKIVETNDYVTHAFIAGPDGRVLSHNDIAKVNTFVSKPLLEAMRTDPSGGIFKDGDSYDTLIPILGQGRTPVAYVTIGFPAAIIQDKILAIVWKFLLLLLVAVGVSYAAGSIFVLREIVRPLSNLNLIAGKVAGGNLTLEAEKRGDEFGMLSGSFNDMTKSLRGVLVKIKEVAQKLTAVARLMFDQSQKVQKGSASQSMSLQEASKKIEGLNSGVQDITHMVENLSKISQEASASTLEMTASIQEVETQSLKLKESGEDISTSTNQISASLREIAQNVESLTASTDETASSIAEINMSVRQVERNTAETALLSQEVAKDAEDGMKSMTKTTEGMSNIKQAVQTTSKIINTLGERSTQIGEILTVISQVIDQTNLLALNAAIIATQAGEYGKGFSVVAQEIRNLAERTATSTQDISKLIESVQTETAQAISSVDEGLRIVAEGEELSAQSARILSKIGQSSKRALSMVEQIAQATKEQAKASLRVTETSEKISHSVHQIAKAAKEQAMGSDIIQQATEKLKLASLQVHKATAEQSKGSRQIAKVVEEANASVHKISQVVQKHQKESEEILRTIKQNLSLVDENLSAVKNTMGVVDDLVGLAVIFNEEVSRFTL